MKYYKKVTADDILILCIDANNNYSVASKNDPEPLGYVNHSWEGQTGWKEISRAEAEGILGYSLAE